MHHPFSAALIELLDSFQRASIDRTFLGSFGRFWRDRKERELLVEPEVWKEVLEAAETVSRQTPARSLLVSGEQLRRQDLVPAAACRPSRRGGLGACSRRAAPT